VCGGGFCAERSREEHAVPTETCCSADQEFMLCQLRLAAVQTGSSVFIELGGSLSAFSIQPRGRAWAKGSV